VKIAGGLAPDATIIPLEVRRSGTDEAATLLIGKSGSFFKNLDEHCAGKLAGLRVLVRGVIRSQQRASIGNVVLRAMLEKKCPAALDDSQLLEMSEVGIERDLAQRHYYFRLFQTVKLPVKVRRAIRQFLRQRLVIGRRATSRSCDVKICQNQTIVAVGGERLAGETNLV
jgi:hypothetical protein